MKSTIRIFAFAILLFAGQFSWGQNPYPPGFPGFDTIEKTFFDRYDPGAAVFVDLIKKEEGFSIVIRSGDDWHPSPPQLFWSSATRSFLPLDLPKGSGANTFYNHSDAAEFDRQPYCGYRGWYRDAIAYFEKRPNPTDDELNALARAYSQGAQNMTTVPPAAVYTSADSNEVLRLDLQRPRFTAQQAALFSERMDRANELFARIEARNPSYQTVVGTIGTKHANEVVFKYLWLSILYDEKEARAGVPSGLYAPFIRESAYNLLQSCPPDAILLTYGDSDTYPLLYLQLTENVRPDVLVANVSLLSSPYYNRHLRRDTIFGALPPARTLPQTYYDQVPVFYPSWELHGPAASDTISIKDYFAFLQNDRHREESPHFNTTYNFPSHYVVVPVKKLPAAGRQRLPDNLKKLGQCDTLYVHLDRYTLTDVQTVIDWVATNGFKRPVCFSTTCSDQTLKPFGAHLVQQGMVFRLYPIAPQPWTYFSPSEMMDLDGTWKLWKETFQWKSRDTIASNDKMTYAQLYFVTAVYMSQQFIKMEDKPKAQLVLDDYCRLFPNGRFIWDSRMIHIAEAYAKAADPDAADKVLITMFDNYDRGHFDEESRAAFENQKINIWDIIEEFDLKTSREQYQRIFKD